jgi:hypothetical protein
VVVHIQRHDARGECETSAGFLEGTFCSRHLSAEITTKDRSTLLYARLGDTKGEAARIGERQNFVDSTLTEIFWVEGGRFEWFFGYPATSTVLRGTCSEFGKGTSPVSEDEGNGIE